MKRFLLALLLFGVVQAAPMPSIKLVGLSKDKAVVMTNNRPVVLRPGEFVYPDGPRLMSATARQAVFAWDGQEIVVQLNNVIGGAYQEKKTREVRLMPDEAGMYLSSGFINQQSVDFLVDSGATYVSLSSVTARALSIPYFESKRMVRVSTAVGDTIGHEVVLDSVRVGDIELRNVAGLVLEGEFPDVILLGMSYLNRVDVERSRGLMVLRHTNQ